ncbi:MAG: iron-containing alcohol dehydrogenase [Bacteroidales bacterium]|nr:iron-containing alcohol dehydrogenase [Bacteroidales bacterium]MBN2761895.1 iron-containing alcohol dehydrogenase [Bacteroidales bacterium]
MTTISLYNPGNITFGRGSIDQLVKDDISSGRKRVFLISAEAVLVKIKKQLNALQNSGIIVHTDTSLQNEPSFNDVERILAEARDFMPDTVAGIGGGSVMDLAKLIAVFTTFKEPVKNYVGSGCITERRTHLVCAPTTAGTGSEASPNAVIFDETDNTKKAFISPWLIPDAAYIDPSLALGLSAYITAYTGIDALTHCIETFANKKAHPLTDTLALKGITLITENLLKATKNIQDIQPRISLSLGSLYGGICLGPVNTAAVHALAYPLGNDYKIPHGLSNAILLPYVMEFNLGAAEEKYAAIAEAIGIANNTTRRIMAIKGIAHIRRLIEDCGLPVTLHDAGIKTSSIEKMAISAMEVKRLLNNNLKEVTLKDVIDIYQHAL